MTLEAARLLPTQDSRPGSMGHTGAIADQLVERSYFTLPEGITVLSSALTVQGTSRRRIPLGEIVPASGSEYFPVVNMPKGSGYVLNAGLDSERRRGLVGQVNDSYHSLRKQTAEVEVLRRRVPSVEAAWLTNSATRGEVDAAEQELVAARRALGLAESRYPQSGKSLKVEDAVLAQDFVVANPLVEAELRARGVDPGSVESFLFEIPVFEPVRIHKRP